MTAYHYPQSSLIDQVTFKKTANGSLRAYLHADASAKPENLASIIDTLRSQDNECIPYTFMGKPTLEVRGFGKEEKLVKLLQDRQWIAGKAKVVVPAEDKVGWGELIKRRSLQATGALYAIGDASFFGYGFLDNSPLDMAAGLLYAAPTPILLKYGNNDQSRQQIKDIAKDMAAHFRKEVDAMPNDCALHSVTQDNKKGPLQQAEQLLQRYPSEFMNICYAGAGICIALAAKKHLNQIGKHGVSPETIENWLAQLKKSHAHPTHAEAAAKALHNAKLENHLNMGVGVMTVASGAFGTLVKEKAHDPDEPKNQGLQGIWDRIKAHPLSVVGAGYMVSTLLHAGATIVAMKGQDAQHKKAVPLRAVFVASALMAELMVAMSSKGHGEGVVNDASVDSSILSMAADIIVKQPRTMQNTLIEHMGAFLGQPKVLAISNDEAIRKLREEVEHLRENPWACRDATMAVSQQNPAPVKMALPSGWQAKIMTQPRGAQAAMLPV